ncbi:MAG: hypothetical protein NC203_10960 [Firmicutes bacterium]|nr:hypothetical protein [Bacillota bacterium]
MNRQIIALLEVDDDTAFEEHGDGPISYLEKEMGWLEQSQIFLKDAFITDEDECDVEQAYLNYLAEWIFESLGENLSGKSLLCYNKWKQLNNVFRFEKGIKVQ